MKSILKTEELAMFALSILLFQQLSFAWWWFVLLFLLPDISILAYLINSKTGAFFYNLFHFKALGILIGTIGFFMQNEIVILIGLIIFGHAAFDRMLGFGLKYNDSFKHTHLGTL